MKKIQALKSKQGKYLVIGLIHTLKFSTFVMFVGIIYFFFEALKSNVKFNLMHP
jgi:hypothetical protein